MIIDSHAHVNDRQFDEDRAELLAQIGPGQRVCALVNVGASPRDVRESQELANAYPQVYAAVGIHPDYAADVTDDLMEEMYVLCKNPKTVAVGEIGMDFYWDKAPHDVQKEAFIRQLQMAKETGFPINVHSRDAAQETFDIIKAEHAGTTGGIIHCFSSSAQMAVEYVKMGYEIGIGGVITFKNGRVLREVAAAVPLEHIVVETDCPYLAPVPYRGKRNCSLYLPLVIEEIAKVKELDPQLVEEQIYQNTRRIYHRM